MRRLSLIQLASLSAASVVLPRRVNAQSTPEKIRLIAIPSDALTPLYYGLKNDLYLKAGIDLEIITASSGSAAATAVIAGSYEIANSSLLPIMTAHLRDIPITIVCPQAVYTPENPFTLLQIPADSSAKSGADLNGKTVAVSALNDSAQLSISAWVDAHGGDATTLKFVEIPAAATDEALAQHRVAAGLILEPQLDMALAAGKTKTLGDAYGAIGKKFMFAAYVGRIDWAMQHPDLLKRFVTVTAQAATYTNAHPMQTAGMMSEITKVPLPIMQHMKRVVCATSLDPSLVQPLIDAAVKYHQISRAFPAKEILFTPS